MAARVDPPTPNAQALAYLKSLPDRASTPELGIGDLSVAFSGEPERVDSVEAHLRIGPRSRDR